MRADLLITGLRGRGHSFPLEGIFGLSPAHPGRAIDGQGVEIALGQQSMGGQGRSDLAPLVPGRLGKPVRGCQVVRTLREDLSPGSIGTVAPVEFL